MYEGIWPKGMHSVSCLAMESVAIMSGVYYLFRTGKTYNRPVVDVVISKCQYGKDGDYPTTWVRYAHRWSI